MFPEKVPDTFIFSSLAFEIHNRISTVTKAARFTFTIYPVAMVVAAIVGSCQAQSQSSVASASPHAENSSRRRATEPAGGADLKRDEISLRIVANSLDRSLVARQNDVKILIEIENNTPNEVFFARSNGVLDCSITLTDPATQAPAGKPRQSSLGVFKSGSVILTRTSRSSVRVKPKERKRFIIAVSQKYSISQGVYNIQVACNARSGGIEGGSRISSQVATLKVTPPADDGISGKAAGNQETRGGLFLKLLRSYKDSVAVE